MNLSNATLQPPVLTYPDFSSSSGQFVLDSDAASGHGIGAVLSQKQVERVVDYGSRALHLLERNYCATRLEMLVLLEFLDYFCSICLGVSFSSVQTTMP